MKLKVTPFEAEGELHDAVAAVRIQAGQGGALALRESVTSGLKRFRLVDHAESLGHPSSFSKVFPVLEGRSP